MAKRKFQCSIPVMLTAAATAASILDAFAEDYPQFTSEWLAAYIAKTESVKSIIGFKATEKQHEATLLLNSVQVDVIDHATVVKSQMERGFRNDQARLGELMNMLGFTKNWAKASRGVQGAIIELAHTFDNHTANTALVKELTGARVSPNRIAKIKENAHKLSAANLTQETLKSEAPVVTAEMNIRLNEIYNTAIDICAAGKTVFRKDPVKRALFSFARLSAQQVSVSNRQKPQQEPPTGLLTEEETK
jgi:hypothetical protein